MALKDWFPDENAQAPRGGTVQVGWFLNEARAGVVYAPPERVRSADVNREHSKSASRCPAIINMESRYFLIRVPFDLNLALARDKEGKVSLKNLSGEKSPVRGNILQKVLHVTSEKEWRYKDRPTIQVSLPYSFIADEPVYLTQLDAFAHYRREPMPGTIFGGRFPIHIWPRPLMWAFEWHEPQKPLVLKRGDPWFYVQFETLPQDRAVSVFEAERTPELIEYTEHTAAAVNYVNQTFSLFKDAERVRPKTLLTRKK